MYASQIGEQEIEGITVRIRDRIMLIKIEFVKVRIYNIGLTRFATDTI